MTNDMPELPSPLPAATRRIPLAIGAVLIGAVIGFAAIYGIGGLKRSAAGDSACRPAVDLAQKLAPLAHGEVAALTMATTPLQLPDLAFEDADGRAKKLSDWRGKIVLVNLWATWCVPCRREMPALERLQAKLGGAAFIVLPLSIDRGGLPPVKRFYEELGLEALGIFVDQSGAATSKLATTGVPTTLLIDRDGREIGRLLGAAEWDSPEAIALIRRYLNSPSGGDGAQIGSKT